MKAKILDEFTKMLLFVLLFFVLLYLGKPFLIPVAIAGLIAMVLLPVAKQLEKWGAGKGVSAGIAVIALILLIFGLSYFMVDQIRGLINDLPAVKENVQTKIDSLHAYLNDELDLPRDEQEKVLNNQLNQTFQNIGSFFTSMLYSTGYFLTIFFIIAIYAYFFISYRHKLKHFLLQLISSRYQDKAKTIFQKISDVANSYITGVFLVILILSICNSVALWIIGVRHPLLFGVLAGLLNIIPFIGSLVGSLIPVIFVLLTRESYFYPIIVAAYFLFIQLVESYFLTPNITGTKVKLNPLATIMALMLGSVVWGIAGMILFIPYLGVLKVVFDNLNKLQPFGEVIGKDGIDNGPIEDDKQ